MMTRKPVRYAAALTAAIAWLLTTGLATAQLPPAFTSEWGLAVATPNVNTNATEGCPIETDDGLSLMIASTRENGFGGLDIWSADRPSTTADWGTPVNLGSEINSDAAEFCPSPAFGRFLLFVRNPAGIDQCGGDGGDIYISRQSPTMDWSTPVLLGCSPLGPNTAGGERSPSVVETPEGTFLFYSTDVGGDSDIYVSQMLQDGQFGPGEPISSLNTEFNDFMPNVRARPEGGFEIVFNSDRPGWGPGNRYPVFGGQDIYWSWIPGVHQGNWKAPQNLGPNVNTAGGETRATLSADGKRLNFGRDGDIFTSER